MISIDDIKQEYEIQKWMHPNTFVGYRVFDVMRSKAYNYSYKNKYNHVSIEALLRRPDGEEIMPYYDNRKNINEDIDLKALLSRLTPDEYSLVMLIYKGFTQEEIAIKKNISRSLVSKRISKIKTKLRGNRNYYAESTP